MAGLSSELRSLVKRYDTLQQDITRHQELLDRLETLVKARQAGNGRMQLPVELGLGYSIEGVVEDTSKVIVNMGVDDLWAELEVGRALVFVKERIHLLEQRKTAMKAPIARIKDDYRKMAQTLRTALEMDADDPST